MKKKYVLSLVSVVTLLLLSGCTKSCEKTQENKALEVAVFFETPSNNAEVTSPVEVKFGVKGMKVRPALQDVNDKTSGHHHILIDNPKGYIEKGQAIPVDAQHIHYGKGETSAQIDLPPGVHTLSMQFADGAHLSYGKEMAATITITVVEKPKTDE